VLTFSPHDHHEHYAHYAHSHAHDHDHLIFILIGIGLFLLFCHVVALWRLGTKVGSLGKAQTVVQPVQQPLAAGYAAPSAVQGTDDELTAVIVAAIAAYEQDK